MKCLKNDLNDSAKLRKTVIKKKVAQECVHKRIRNASNRGSCYEVIEISKSITIAAIALLSYYGMMFPS